MSGGVGGGKRARARKQGVGESEISKPREAEPVRLKTSAQYYVMADTVFTEGTGYGAGAKKLDPDGRRDCVKKRRRPGCVGKVDPWVAFGATLAELAVVDKASGTWWRVCMV